jgi:hypothetical protein
MKMYVKRLKPFLPLQKTKGQASENLASRLLPPTWTRQYQHEVEVEARFEVEGLR